MASYLVHSCLDREVRVRSPGWGHSVVFLGKMLNLKCLFFSQVYKWVLNVGSNPAMDWHPIQGRVEILLVVSCYGNRDKLPSDESLGLYADFNFEYYFIHGTFFDNIPEGL